jgi:hypothetical protein
MPSTELRTFNFLLGSAVAKASPHDPSDLATSDSEHGQTAKTLAGNILPDLFHNAVVVESRRFEIKPEEAQQREGSFRGIPLSGFGSRDVETQTVNT